MDNCAKKNYCAPCETSCGGCGPAAYDCDFSIMANPTDPSFWNVTWCGKLHKVKLPTISETDTKHSLNYSNATWNYDAENHQETWTGGQIGSIIQLGDLRDVKTDYETDAMCYELIYHKYGECGEGCRSIEDAWSTFSIDSQNALGGQIRYIRGANRYGCPYFLDTPSNESQFWYLGWRPNGEVQYSQPTSVSQLPTNSNGDPYVLSQNPTTKAPVVGVLPWNCVLENIFANLGVNVNGIWREIQGTPGYTAEFNQITGEFHIDWNDWNNIATIPANRAGYGTITGKLNWAVSFDVKTGTLKYVVNNIYFDTVTWTPDEGVTASTNPTLYLYAVPIPSGAEQNLIPGGLTFGKTKVTRVMNTTIPCNQTILVGPGQTVGPFDFVHMHLDWTYDDEGYMGVEFKSALSGWKTC